MTEPSKLAAALAKVQADLKPIKRNSKGQTGTRLHKYSGLDVVSEVVLPLLSEHGLSFTAKTRVTEHGFVLAYSLLHVSGEREDGEWPLNASANAQGRGSEITYARRYCLQAITGATSVGEDDDGHAASQAPPAPPQRARVRVPGPDHERLRQPEPEERVNGQKAARSRRPENGSQWQDLPPEDRPGSATDGQITHIQITYKEMGYKTPAERDKMLHASEWIIGRPLGGPNGDRTHKNLSFNEARKLGDTLDSTDRTRLEEDLAEAGA